MRRTAASQKTGIEIPTSGEDRQRLSASLPARIAER